MKVKTTMCAMCGDDRVILSMTKNEAEMLLVDCESGFPTNGMMYRRAVKKLREALPAPPPKKPKKEHAP